MDSGFDSTNRRTGDYLLFALAFIGFMVFVGGIIVSSPPAAFAGALFLLLCILGFRLRPAPET